MEELQNERSELTGLKRSLQQLRAESAKDRKRLEKDREGILRARVTLENEKRKVAWKNTLLEIKARSALASQKTLKKEDKAEKKQATRPGGHENNEEVASATPSGSATEEGAVVLGVRLGDEDYGIDISRVREIMKRRPITPVPRQPVYVEGVMNVRGDIIPVINLRKRFDLKGAPPENPHVVIVDSAEGIVGILVDSVSEVIRLPQDRIHPAPPIARGMDGEYIRGICRVGEQLLLYLDVEKILKKATPVTMLHHGAQLGISSGTGHSSLSYYEQRVLKAIPPNGIGKTRLMKRTGSGDIKLRRTIALLSRKGLVKMSKEGSLKIIRRKIRPMS
jgi:purine-binding chemotaxis protein CheW